MKDSATEAKNHALRLIRYRGRSEKELSDRLSDKGFSQRTISETITGLKESGIVDDQSLAVSLDEIAKNVKFLGNRGTAYFLRRRGFSELTISELDLDDNDELERAIRFTDKKMRVLGRYSLKDRIKRIRGMLLRRGYSYETISEVTARLRKGRPRSDDL